MAKKDIPIKYTSRDFESIRNDLIQHAKRYYPSTFKDFNEASFGSQMIDATAYIGDILSFYTDYQANEAFLDTATEYNNVVRLARQMGYKFRYSTASTGKIDIFLSIPANSNGIGVDTQYLPRLRSGATFVAGTKTFTLLDDIDFSDTGAIEVVVSAANSNTGIPTLYAVKATGRVISGKLKSTSKTIGDFKKFRTVSIEDPNITEVISVIDSEGHIYTEVENLSQDIIYASIPNGNSDKDLAPNLLKPQSVARRFVVERNREKTLLQFGYGSDSEIKNPGLADPSEVVLQIHGKDYISDPSFDPARLNQTSKFGIAPANTTLFIIYRTNASDDTNAGAGSIDRVTSAQFQFTSPATLNGTLMSQVEASIEVTNEEPILGDVTLPNIDELKALTKAHFATQNRAVTREDYASVAYALPPQFGSIKRVAIFQDPDSFKRNLNMYLVALNSDGSLALATESIKENLKVWLNNYKMVNDTLDLLDANIINIGLNFSVIAERGTNELDLLINCKRELSNLFASKFHIGESLDVAQVYQRLNRVPGVVDTTNVEITQPYGPQYGDIYIDIEKHISIDGQRLVVPQDSILEIKYLNTDITGQVTGNFEGTPTNNSGGY